MIEMTPKLEAALRTWAAQFDHADEAKILHEARFSAEFGWQEADLLLALREVAGPKPTISDEMLKAECMALIAARGSGILHAIKRVGEVRDISLKEACAWVLEVVTIK
jgi:hypothetical protein